MTPRRPSRSPVAGFTLIETLVALAILAVSAVALLGATEAHVRRIGALEARAAAGWAAENHLAELTLGLDPVLTPPMLGFAFKIEAVRGETSDPELERIDLSVIDIAKGQRRASLTGFVDARASQGADE